MIHAPVLFSLWNLFSVGILNFILQLPERRGPKPRPVAQGPSETLARFQGFHRARFTLL